MDRTNAVLALTWRRRLKSLPGTAHLFTTVGSTSGGRVVKGQGDVTRGTIYVSMPELEDRTYSQFDVQLKAREPDGRLPRPARQRQRRLGLPGGPTGRRSSR